MLAFIQAKLISIEAETWKKGANIAGYLHIICIYLRFIGIVRIPCIFPAGEWVELFKSTCNSTYL